MTRETILEDVLSIESPFIVINLGTGTGKSKVAIEKTVQKKCEHILVVCPRLSLCKINWPNEFKKWGHEDLLSKTTLCCYRSLYKYVDQQWDIIIFDEAHHLTDNCLAVLKEMHTKSALFLSATIKREIKYMLKGFYPNLQEYFVGMRKTIDEGILPDPKVFLVPMELGIVQTTASIVVNPNAKERDPHKYTATLGNYWRCKRTGRRCVLTGTQSACYRVFSGLWDFYVRKGIDRKQVGGAILKWCAKQKNSIVRRILKKLETERTLTFCCDIEQTEALGPNSINSKDKRGLEVLEKFNLGEVNHIQACNMLDEGINLADCRVGIFANINSSERLIIQRTGRILRHSDPIIIIPFFKNTREEELVTKMLANYNPELITSISSISQMKL